MCKDKNVCMYFRIQIVKEHRILIKYTLEKNRFSPFDIKNQFRKQLHILGLNDRSMADTELFF